MKKPPKHPAVLFLWQRNVVVCQQGFNVITGAFLYLHVNLSDILSNQSDGKELYAAQEPNRQHNGGPPRHGNAYAQRDNSVDTGGNAAGNDNRSQRGN